MGKKRNEEVCNVMRRTLLYTFLSNNVLVPNKEITEVHKFTRTQSMKKIIHFFLTQVLFRKS